MILYNDVKLMGAIKLCDKNLLSVLAHEELSWVKNFNWERVGQTFTQIVELEDEVINE